VQLAYHGKNRNERQILICLRIIGRPFWLDNAIIYENAHRIAAFVNKIIDRTVKALICTTAG